MEPVTPDVAGLNIERVPDLRARIRAALQPEPADGRTCDNFGWVG